MATMLNGAAVMDAALLLIAGNESCPQPQTSEHLAAVEIMRLKHIIILQNKVDLIREQAAEEHQKSIVAFVKGTPFSQVSSPYHAAQLLVAFFRHRRRIITYCSHFCAAQVQHRRC